MAGAEFKEKDNVEWILNNRGIVLRTPVAGQHDQVFITYDAFKCVVSDWLTRFPEERQTIPQGKLAELATLDQEMARFRDTLKKFAKKLLDDPELLTLSARIMQLVSDK